jgi:hypothetical protein
LSNGRFIRGLGRRRLWWRAVASESHEQKSSDDRRLGLPSFHDHFLASGILIDGISSIHWTRSFPAVIVKR